ncbi:restriction endonuclease [Bacillus atrophaeus]|uniref:HNH endonuclease n=1 Tax=Bacillus atrophaeus TaxID=1452 RepID=UPI00227EA468|nr:HNH endonuclease [Bacillus atrophaeus]MCY8913409.1 restriction endonuclease [Bacillus atrophaeus]MCY9113633.1 restriction endonuclease [Bacillus atrophaeus]MEC0925867.1 restriction endonuclease [Bacillus atrophaeus]MEC0933981.1 restriction endonuclease [Bacillus atrophaeus]
MTLHVILKFPVDYTIAGGTTDTITEHQELCEAKNRLIWGHSSNKSTSLVSEVNRNRLKAQISNGENTYSFFLANNKGKRELYVGKMNTIYRKGEILTGSPLIDYIPSYYASSVGTATDKNNILVDVSTFFRIDEKYLINITLESTGTKVGTVENRTSVFLVNIDEELEKLLIDLLTNLESNFQYQVEQVEVPATVTVVDQPRNKPPKTTVGGTSSYKRDAKTAKTAIVSAQYLCEIDPSHKDFISRITKENYVEAHHLIPMEFQYDFPQSIDVEANIVSLCASCHKKLHHATFTDIQPLVEKLYDDRVDRLDDCGISISKTDLLEYYK